ncbi:hypothetical protein GCM10010201_00760 [Pilimelia columellifera subsp. columellifera]|uniref:Uncharacterized protein n=2 Tax=Pilimelia TaxID=53370 RepID=A0ABN3MVZ5_9ACTN
MDVLGLAGLKSWDWETIGDQATSIGVLVALLVGITTNVIMARQEKVTRQGLLLQQRLGEEAANRADAAALRTEAAARLTEEYTRRVVVALETLAASNLQGSPAPTRGVQWNLVNDRKSRYRLSNVGDKTARDVVVTAHETLILRDVPEHAVVQPTEAVTFLALQTFGTKDSTITVSWLDDKNSERQIWRYPLPPAS